MRLWSLHPRYLDTAGLVALWREGLLAQKVLKGNTRGYKNHPQLIRFKKQDKPVLAVAKYLYYIYQEAKKRDYNFNRDKIESGCQLFDTKIAVSRGQLEYELKHLLNKLKDRSPEKYHGVKKVGLPDVHPCFTVVPGAIAEWEKNT